MSCAEEISLLKVEGASVGVPPSYDVLPLLSEYSPRGELI
jgi:hypothetical protein